jgi:hypothetical protein
MLEPITAALGELQLGDTTDAVLLFFGSLIGFDPKKALTDTVTQANNLVTDPTLQSIVTTNLHTLDNFVDSTTPIAQVTVTPSL